MDDTVDTDGVGRVMVQVYPRNYSSIYGLNVHTKHENNEKGTRNQSETETWKFWKKFIIRI